MIGTENKELAATVESKEDKELLTPINDTSECRRT